MDIKKIENISAKTEQAIQRKSAYALPDRPSESGMRADEIKKAFYSSITDKNDSVLSELKRVVNESNDIFEEMQNEMQEHADNNLSTIQFAENERQKSKNLLYIKDENITLSGMNYNSKDQKISINGTSFLDYIDSHNIVKGSKILLKAGKTYTLSIQNLSGSGWFDLIITGEKVSDNSIVYNVATLNVNELQETFTLTEDMYINKLEILWAGKSTVNREFYVQLEENNQATDWQFPYGAIVHKEDKPVVFAESERQKSKNLLTLKQQDYSRANINIKINETTQELIFNGVANGINEDYIAWIKPLTLKAGKTYTFSFDYVSGSLSGGLFVYVFDTGKGLWTDIFGGSIAVKRLITITPTEDVFFNAIRWYVDTYTNASNYTVKLQIEENNQATNWQYPYGAIVHEKQIVDVEHIETIYDMSSNDSNINKGYTSGIQANTGATSYRFGITKEKYKRIIVDASLDFVNTSVEIEVLGEDAQQGGLITTNIRDNSYGISTMSFRLYANGDFRCIYANYQTPTAQYEKNNNATYIITRIRGVKA